MLALIYQHHGSVMGYGSIWYTPIRNRLALSQNLMVHQFHQGVQGFLLVPHCWTDPWGDVPQLCKLVYKAR